MKSHFPGEPSAAAFLTLFSNWWVLSDSKARYSAANYLGNVAVIGDNKPSFFHAMADWVQNWQEKKIPNCEKFTAFSNRFAIRENIKIPCFTYGRFGCGRI